MKHFLMGIVRTGIIFFTHFRVIQTLENWMCLNIFTASFILIWELQIYSFPLTSGFASTQRIVVSIVFFVLDIEF